MNYLKTQKEIKLRLQLFTSYEILKNYVVEHKVNLLILDSDHDKDLEFLYNIIDQIIYFHDEEPEENLDNIIFKYQSMEEIINRILQVQNRGLPNVATVEKDTKIITIYGPAYYMSQMAFAIGLAMAYQKKYSTLYLNFHPYLDLSYFTNQSNNKSLSDIFFYLKQNNSNLFQKIESTVNSNQYMNYINSMDHNQDIFDLTKGELLRLMEVFQGQDRFKIIIIEVAGSFQGLPTLLAHSDLIIVPKYPLLWASRKTTMFYEQLNSFCFDYSNRIREVELDPYSHENEGFQLKDLHMATNEKVKPYIVF